MRCETLQTLVREVETAWKKDATLKEALKVMVPQLGQNSPVVGEESNFDEFINIFTTLIMYL